MGGTLPTAGSEHILHGRNKLVTHTYPQCGISLQDAVEGMGGMQLYLIVQTERGELMLDDGLVTAGTEMGLGKFLLVPECDTCTQRDASEITGSVLPVCFELEGGARETFAQERTGQSS